MMDHGVVETVQELRSANTIRLTDSQILSYYNCFGFTVYALELYPALNWLNDEAVMEDILTEKTTTVTELEVTVGDIGVYRGHSPFNEDAGITALLHTAIVSKVDTDGAIIFIHKPGQHSLEVRQQSTMKQRYTAYGTLYEYRRKST